MSGITDLDTLLRTMAPQLDPEVYVFVSLGTEQLPDLNALQPVATCVEEEGVTLVVREAQAREQDWPVEQCFNRISLKVHSSLEAVGLTAAFSAALADASISCNVVAGFYHDHLFVPCEDAQRAVRALEQLAAGA